MQVVYSVMTEGSEREPSKCLGTFTSEQLAFQSIKQSYASVYQLTGCDLVARLSVPSEVILSYLLEAGGQIHTRLFYIDSMVVHESVTHL